ncbi:MAG: type VI secretion system tip protein VgrG [Thermodesulfobacteriota bacterium]
MTAPTSFKFISQGFPPDTFQVVSFVGEEALSQPYEFNINLATTQPLVDLDRVLDNPATLVISQGDQELPYHGVVINIDQVNRFKEYTFYQAVLTPRLYLLGLTRRNQVFLDKTIPEVLAAVLQDGGFTSLDYEFRLQGDQSLYRVHEMVCQYNQSHLDFFSFWTENMGLYYYFEQGRGQEKVVVTDTHLAHRPFTVEPDSDRKGVYAPPSDRRQYPSPDEGQMLYATPSGLEHDQSQEVIFHFRRRQRKVQRSVQMKDYNYQKPSLDLTVETGVAPHGVGQVNIHGDLVHYNSPEEGRLLARIRAEELRCRETICTGLSRNARLRTGHVFHLAGHYQDDFNRKYMTIQISHTGNQKNYLTGGLKKAVGDLSGNPINILTMTLKRIFLAREESPVYENRFIALPSEVQFRPERKTPPAQILGAISAVVDGAQDGKYAEIDEQGRYKVILPFDSSGRKGLKASTWIRLVQPTGGGKQGLHFPLRPGTEVLLSFLSGDPNRPVIVGTVPNPENPNIVTSANSSRAGLQSASGHQIVMDDTEGQGFLSLGTGDGKSYMVLGSTGSASTSGTGGSTDQGGGSSSGDTGNFWSYVFGNAWKETWGTANSIFGGAKTDVFLGAKTGLTAAVTSDVFLGLKSSIEAAVSNRFSLVQSSDFNLGAKVSLSASRNRMISKNLDLAAAKDVKLAGGAEEVASNTIYTTVAAILGSLLATASGLGVTLSASALANVASQGGFLEKDPSDAMAGAQGLGLVGEIASIVGLAAAEIALIAALWAEKKTKKTATLELNHAGMKVNVEPPSVTSPHASIDMTCKNGDDTSSIKMDGATARIESKPAFARFFVDLNSSHSQAAKIAAETDAYKSALKLDHRVSLSLDSSNKFKIEITDDGITLSNPTTGNQIVLGSNSCEMKCATSSIKLNGTDIDLGFTNSLNAGNGAVKVMASGQIILG